MFLLKIGFVTMLTLHSVAFLALNVWVCFGQHGDNNEGVRITAEDVFRFSNVVRDSHTVIRGEADATDCIRDLYSVVILQCMEEEDVRALFEPLADDDCQIERIFCSDLLVQVEMSVWSEETLNKIMDMEDVSFVQEVYNVSISNNFRLREDVWGLNRINQRNLPLDTDCNPACEFPDFVGIVWWKVAGEPYCPQKPNIFVMDTGINYKHVEFEKRAHYHYDYYGQGGWDYNGHGTHVAGIAAGKKYGLAPNSNLWSVRVLDSNGFGTSIAIQQGLISILTRPKKPGVVNMSFGGYYSDPVGEALIHAIQMVHDMPVIAGAGNDATLASEFWPAKIRSVVTVGATDRDDNMASFSNYGDAVNIFAPGVDIYSAYTTSQTRSREYATLNGTSMAAPLVAGAAALIKEKLPDLRAREVATTLHANSSKSKVQNSKDTPDRHLLYACIPNQHIYYADYYSGDYWEYHD